MYFKLHILKFYGTKWNQNMADGQASQMIAKPVATAGLEGNDRIYST